MKTAIKFLLLLAVVAAFVVASRLYLDFPVRIAALDFEIAPPASVLAALAFLFFALTYAAARLLGWLLFFPSRWRRWRETSTLKKRAAAADAALAAIALGENAAAAVEKAPREESTFAPLAVLAARAPGISRAESSRLLRAAGGGDSTVALLARALLAESENDGDAAARATAGINIASCRARELLSLLARANRQSGDWSRALAAARRLDKLAPDAADSARAVVAARIDAARDAAALRAFWSHEASAAEKREVAAAAAYIRKLHSLGDGDGALLLLKKSLKNAPNDAQLLRAAAAVGGGDEPFLRQTLERAEAGGDDEDPDRLAARAQIAARLRLWGKAKQYYEMAHARDPQAARHVRGLADLLEEMGGAPEEIGAARKRAQEIEARK